jgi:RNA polymerase sigma-70 factor (ECF subfamily)
MSQVLFERWLEGDEPSFCLIYRTYFPRPRQFAAALVGSSAEGEDLAQEVFLRLHATGPRLEQEGIANGRAWLYTVARRLAYQYSAYRARWERLAGQPEAVQEVLMQTKVTMPDELLEAAEVGAYIDEALDRLPEPQRELLLLRYRECLGYGEMAQVVQSTIPQVKARLHYARRLLHGQLRKLRIVPNILR